jgi:hypothetical protein
MTSHQSLPDAPARDPRRPHWRLVLLLAVLGAIAVAWTTPMLLISPDAEGRALIAAGVPRSEFPALIAEGGTAYAADTLAHDWADSCEQQGEATADGDGPVPRLLLAWQRFNPFAEHIDCARVRAIALRTESLRDDADDADDTCTDADENGDDNAAADTQPDAVVTRHRHRMAPKVGTAL